MNENETHCGHVGHITSQPRCLKRLHELAKKTRQTQKNKLPNPQGLRKQADSVFFPRWRGDYR